MDIDKLGEAVAWVTPIDENFILTTKSLRGIIILRDLATQVIEVSEAMPAKKELPLSIRTCTGESIGGWEAGYADGFNLCHDEFVLWLTKRLSELEKVVRKFYKGELAENDEKVWIYSLDLKDLLILVRNQILGREK